MSNINIDIKNGIIESAFHGGDADKHFKMIAEEIVRLEKLKESMEKTYKEKKLMASMLHMVRMHTHDKSPFAAFEEKEKDTNNYYEKTVIWLDTKIKAWGQVLNKRKDKNMLDKINEAMDEWLQASWIYLGQENIVQESKAAKEEYEVFQIVLCLTIKNNKPTRRGGKKHKKKKVA